MGRSADMLRRWRADSTRPRVHDDRPAPRTQYSIYKSALIDWVKTQQVVNLEYGDITYFGFRCPVWGKIPH